MKLSLKYLIIGNMKIKPWKKDLINNFKLLLNKYEVVYDTKYNVKIIN